MHVTFAKPFLTYGRMYFKLDYRFINRNTNKSVGF